MQALTWVANRVFVVVVGDVGVGCPAAPGELQHHHAGCAYKKKTLSGVEEVTPFTGLPTFIMSKRRE